MRPLKVAWISDYPVEWMPAAPAPLRALPRQHPATWAMVLLEEFERRAGLEIHVVLLRRGIERDWHFEHNRVNYHVLRAPGRLRAPSLFWADTLLIRRLLRRIGPDLVHAWGSERGASLIASRLPYPYLVTIQGLFGWYRQVVPPTLYDRFTTWIEGAALRRARVATTESSFGVKFLQERYPRLQVHQAEHAPNWFFHRVERKPRTAPVRLLSVSSIGYRKGTDVLLKALDQLRAELEFELVMVSYPQPAFLDSLRPSLSPEIWQRARFLTNLDPADIARELARATLVILPTRADTSPNSAKEAAVAGVPAVATEVGGIPDYIVSGENGILFAPDQVPACVEAIRAAARHPLFGQGAVNPERLQRAREYLSPGRMAERFEAAYGLALKAYGRDRREGTRS